MEIIKDIIIPIITSFIGAFLGGITYTYFKSSKDFKSNKIKGNNSKMVNGDNYEFSNQKRRN